MSKDVLVSFIGDTSSQGNDTLDIPSEVWNVLIVDDDPLVHSSTRIAIQNVQFEGRLLNFISLYSAKEAEQFLENSELPIAVILLDVVMESDDAGLKLVSTIRDIFQLKLVRIILRTGQPGYAPEIETIKDLDINDYKSKPELTRNGLYTALAVAIRSYSQLQQLEQTRRGLEKIVEASCDLSRLHGLNAYSEGAVLQICSLLGVAEEGLVCVRRHSDHPAEPFIIAAAGTYANLINQPLNNLPCPSMRKALDECLDGGESRIGELTTLYFKLSVDRTVAACIRSDRELSMLDKQLLQAFCASISIGFDNVYKTERLEEEAYVDPLLGIPNRNGFERVIVRQQRRFRPSLLLLIDIDDFSAINATLDQHYGDDVLRTACRRVQSLLNESTVLGRVSGDCFALIGPMSESDCDDIVQAFHEPFEINGNKLLLSVTCGVVKLGGSHSAVSANELLKDANIALKQAKEFNRGKIRYFDASLRKAAENRIALLGGLREAFSARQLFLHYQPQIDLATGRLIGAEALLRWCNPAGKFIPPDLFIPLAEQSGIILPIGTWVLRTACLHAKKLLNQGHKDFRMAVNVSHAQLRDPEFIEQLRSILFETGLPGRNLEIELTESIVAEDINLVNQLLKQVHALGVTVALDDFGTGYSSLSLLNKIAVDRLKIDRAFISTLEQDAVDSHLAKVIVHLAKDFHLMTIAEGIENDRQLQALISVGCDEGQGYFIARPMDIDALERWILDHTDF